MGHDELTRADRKVLKSDLLDVKNAIEQILTAYQNCMALYAQTIKGGYDHGESTLDEFNDVHKYGKRMTLKKVRCFLNVLTKVVGIVR